MSDSYERLKAQKRDILRHDRAVMLSRLLPTAAEYRSAMDRIHELTRGATPAEHVDELDRLADVAVAYEALDDAAKALAISMKAYMATRHDQRLGKVYKERAEVVIRAWIEAIVSQEALSKQAAAPEAK